VQNNPTTIPVVAAALIAPDGLILLHQRKLGGAMGGLWEFPGGKVEEGESPDLALVRELEEELGIAVAADDLDYLAQASEPGNPHVILLYTCRRWRGEPVCLAGEGIAWVAPQDLLAHEMPPLDIPLARELISAI
jgi:8-oxo-dGTP diphosphatase